MDPWVVVVVVVVGPRPVVAGSGSEPVVQPDFVVVAAAVGAAGLE